MRNRGKTASGKPHRAGTKAGSERPALHRGTTAREGDSARKRAATVAGILAAVFFGILLYLSHPSLSLHYFFPNPFRAVPPAFGPAFSLVFPPLLCGVFAWLATGGMVSGVVSAVLIVVAGGWICWSPSLEFLLEMKFAPFLLLQVVLAAVPPVLLGWKRVRSARKIVALTVLLVLVASHAALAYRGGERIFLGTVTEPPAESYGFDGVLFLKIFYLLERGRGFHDALGTAFRDDARFASVPENLGQWRMPTIFYIWSAVASRGDTLIALFLLLSSGLMVCAYLAARKFADYPFALVASCMTGTYLYFGAVSFWFMELEYWGLFFAMPAATLYLYGKRSFALPLAVLAGLTREWTALILVAGMAENLWRRRWAEAAWWACGNALVLGAYAANFVLVYRYLEAAGVSTRPTGSGMGHGGIGFIFYILQYGSMFFPGGVTLMYWIFFQGMAGLVVSNRQNGGIFWATMVLLPLTAFLYYGFDLKPGDPPGTGDYYSVNFVPYLIVAASYISGPLIDVTTRVLEKAFGRGSLPG